MRLKFRAWDKQKKRMIQPHDGDFIGWHAMSNWKDCLEVMQFTGLHDRNGKEIYIGDILEWDEKEWGSPYSEVAEWNYELLSARKNDWPSWCKVIGNIYENPELINRNETNEHP